MAKRRLFAVLITIFVAVSASHAEKKWGIFYTGTSFESMKKGIANINNKNGLIPVGISIYGDKVYFMFVPNAIGATDYYIQTFAKTADVNKIQSVIQGKVNEGWIPFDLTFTTDKVAVLYLKCKKISIDSWKVITTPHTFKALQDIIPKHRGYFPLGFAFTGQKSYLILIRSAQAKVSRWLIKNCGGSNEEVDPIVNGKIKEGYKVYGFEYQGGQAGIVFLQ